MGGGGRERGGEGMGGRGDTFLLALLLHTDSVLRIPWRERRTASDNSVHLQLALSGLLDSDLVFKHSIKIRITLLRKGPRPVIPAEQSGVRCVCVCVCVCACWPTS